ncbi:MAG: tetratricopeptide repeat protein [Cyclobacteriaceae bacterium]|nr:tetratricopeptide repeat protein [Cyclobacteriaceae bacterium]UYN86071.1 MAG: tetratricopeptide repeat protein [Cyclobacteriaceae bacterium]
MKVKRVVFVLGWCLTVKLSIPFSASAQQSIVHLFTSDRALANKHLEKGEIVPALRLYERSKRGGNTYLMMGRCYFMLKEYQQCIDAYARAYSRGDQIERQDYLNLAEAQLSLKNYEQAELNYQKIIDAEPTNEWIQKKLWRISNLHYLYEDSIHFATRLLSVNTSAAEWNAVSFDGGIVFLSNRTTNKPVKNIDASTQQDFFRLYQAMEKPDTLLEGWGRLYSNPKLYTNAFPVNGNMGSFSLYDNRKKMVYTASQAAKNAQGIRMLGLYFAELREGKWQPAGVFPFNENSFSLIDPFIDDTGKILYFASDKPGGLGGMDLYRSEYVNGKWTTPVNLGGSINTAMNEVSPYVHNGMFYFSSTGHAGFGGLDIYKTVLSDSFSDEPVNLGHPLNSPYDDFAFSFSDPSGLRGFMSSNRRAGGLDDDIYEFDMDMQTYPYAVAGILKQMDHSWSDSSSMRVMKNARIRLVDTVRKAIVQEITSDQQGKFSLIIPYFSKYGIYVVDEDGVENMAVFEIPRLRKETALHEVVIIKDIFQSLKN